MKLIDKNKKNLILGALIIVSVFVWGRNLAPVKKKLKDIGRQFKAVTWQPLPKRRASRTQAKDWGRNPFVASGASESSVSGLQLGGIITDAGGRYALINDQIARAGEMVGAYKVVRINEDGVIVNDGIKDTELKLEQ